MTVGIKHSNPTSHNPEPDSADTGFEVPGPDLFSETQGSEEREKQIVAKIMEYQRDRTDGLVRADAMSGIRERTLLLSREEYEKYIDERYAYLPEPEKRLRKEMFGFSHTPETRAVLNRDAVHERSLPYIKTHEETEILEDGPFPEEKKTWGEEHNGGEHPQERVDSHIEATYAEYRHAKQDGNLDAHHAYMIGEVRRVIDQDPSLREMVEHEEEQRNRIYEAVKDEK